MNTTLSTAYNYKVVRQFAIMTVVWGIVGMGLGVFLAAQLVWPALNFDLPWTSFGRLRPLHTNAVIFAFGGCALFASSFYSVQRTCQTQLFRAENCRVLLLGLAIGDRAGSHQLAAGLHHFQGIRRAGMADRYPYRRRLGRLWRRVLRHSDEAQDQAHLRR